MKKGFSYLVTLTVITAMLLTQAIGAAPVSNSMIATPTASKVLVNGNTVSFDAYNISGNNYFKLRDLAKAITGTNKQFEVTWDGTKKAINVISGRPYTVTGGELAKGDGKAKQASLSTAKIYKDGNEVKLTAYTINGNSFFKLGDVGKLFDFCVAWDSGTKTVDIDTTISYNSNTSTQKEKVEISYMNFYASQSDLAEIQKKVDIYNSSQKGITVKLISAAYDEYDTKLKTMAATNTLPDCAYMPENNVIGLAKDGKCVDISDMFVGEDKPLDSLAYTYQGKTVAYSSSNEVLLLYYNKDLFDKAKLDYPPASADKAWTWDQFVGAAKKLTADKNGKTPNDAGFNAEKIATYGTYFNTSTWMWPVMALSNGGGVVSKDGKELLFNKPETIEAAQAIADLSLVHHVAPLPTTYETFPTLDISLLTDKVAMAIGGQWEIGLSINNSINNGLNYGIGVLPKMKKAVTLNTGGAVVVFNTSKHVAEAKTFLRGYCNDENNLGLIQGGIYMPMSRKWYKQEDLLKKWIDNDSHPDYDMYKSAVVDYAMNNAEQVPWYFFPEYDKMEAVITPAMDEVWSGKKSAKEAILKDIMPMLQPIFDKNKN